MDEQESIAETQEKSPNLQCIRDAYELFHSNCRYFGLISLVPVVLAYAVHRATATLQHSIFKGASLLDGRPSAGAIAMAAALGYAAYIFAAVLWGFVTAGITVAVRELRVGYERPTFEEALRRPRERFGAIAASAVIQYFGLVLGFVLLLLPTTYFLFAFGFQRWPAYWLMGGAVAIWVAVASRWMLSVPILVEEDCGVWTSFRRSQKLAARYRPAVMLFVAHAAIVGYIAGKLPYDVFNFVAARFELPEWSGWLPFVLSFVFVAFVEPACAIGLAEVYYSAQDAVNEG